MRSLRPIVVEGNPQIINQASAGILFIFFFILHFRNMSLFLFA